MKQYKTKKRFGQHFLHDSQVIQKLIYEINPQKNDNIVEIGPGLGALTFPLLKEINKLHLVEIDRDIIQRLKNMDNNKLIIHESDALKFGFDDLALHEPLRVVGNLPYNISTPLIFTY